MIDRARANEKSIFLTSAVWEGRSPDNGRRAPSASSTWTLRAAGDLGAGLFVAIGHYPNTKLFLDHLDHDHLATSLPSPAERTNMGVFASGDDSSTTPTARP